jgi:hypothetical protein
MAGTRHVGLMTVRRRAAAPCAHEIGTQDDERGLTSNGHVAGCEEDTRMIARKTLVQRTTVIASIAALALAAIAPSIADAAPRRGHGGHGGRVAAAAVAGIVGTGLAIAASQNRGAYYDDGYYGGGPVYAAPGPYYYGDPSYGPGPHGYGTTVPYVNGQPLAGW